jgi:hypothetical protein
VPADIDLTKEMYQMGRPKKDANPFADLPEEFRAAIESGTEDEIRRRVAEVAFDEQENQRLKADDVDLQEKKAQAKQAGEQYSDGTKMNRLKIKYAHSVLEARGKI